MKYRFFYISSLLLLGVYLICASLYLYHISLGIYGNILYLTRTLPTLFSIFFVIAYIYKYRPTLYSSFTLVALLINLFAEMTSLLRYYEKLSPFYSTKYADDIVYLALDVGLQLGTRVFLTLAFISEPYEKFSYLFGGPDQRKWVWISHAFLVILFTVPALILLACEPSVSTGIILIYCCLTFGLPVSFAYLRIGKLRNTEINESELSCVEAFFGMFIFNVSEAILMFSYTLTGASSIATKYGHIALSLFYWVGIYFLTITIYRSNDETIEEGS